MRFKWGNMEFSSPSRFLREIDSRYVECEDDLAERPQCRREPQEGGFTGRMGQFQRGVSRGEERRDGRTAIEQLRERFDYRFQQKREAEQKQGVKRQPDPRLVAPVQQPRSTEGMRRVATMPAGAVMQPCAYAVGERVEHPTFGVGEITRIESLATDHKVVVVFDEYGSKTLLAKFAKLKKL
jgi:DNA helicase-2/ATP-dependent DNA helicase PcrA